jgi:RNA polymerase sigma-70 factor (ECF subfamily)
MTTHTILDSKQRFQELVMPHLPRLYAMARRLVGEEAEDAVQDALMKAFNRFDQLESADTAQAWLAAILVNCCRDRGRARARQPQEVNIEDVEEFSLYRKIADEDPFPYSESLHIDFLHQFDKEDVREVLLSLPDIYRAPLVLVHMEGFATKEAARILGAPLGTVLSRLHRARKMFERRLWDYAVENDLLKEGVP